MTLLDAADLTRTRAALAGFDELDVAAGEQRPKLSIAAPDELGTVAGVVEELRRNEIPVFDIGLRRPSLDEVFFALTGERPVDETPSGAAELAG